MAALIVNLCILIGLSVSLRDCSWKNKIEGVSLQMARFYFPFEYSPQKIVS